MPQILYFEKCWGNGDDAHPWTTSRAEVACRVKRPSPVAFTELFRSGLYVALSLKKYWPLPPISLSCLSTLHIFQCKSFDFGMWKNSTGVETLDLKFQQHFLSNLTTPSLRGNRDGAGSRSQPQHLLCPLVAFAFKWIQGMVFVILGN